MKLILIASAFLGMSVSAFVMPPSIFHVSRKTSGKVTISYPPSSSLSMAGFGGGASKKGGKKGKNKGAAQKLKPKSQWDKYLKMKKASSVKVAVRVSNEGSDAGEWYEVGKVKSENDEFTELAVVLQRGIIADVSIYILLKKNYFFFFMISNLTEFGNNLHENILKFPST